MKKTSSFKVDNEGDTSISNRLSKLFAAPLDKITNSINIPGLDDDVPRNLARLKR